MSRLRQYYASRYTSAEATNAEFENIIRYLNAAEFGNKTVAELLDKLFDDDGNLLLGIQFRYNPATGIEVLTDSKTDNWTLLAPTESIRGEAGLNLGNIEAPLFSNRVDITSILGQTVFPYVTVAESIDILLWVNGVLQPSNIYTYSQPSGLLTMLAIPAEGSLISLATIRTSPATAFRRIDYTAEAGQTTFPFAHANTEQLAVFRNGIMQRQGGGYDFINDPTTGTVIFTTTQVAGTRITVICITNSAIRDVAGLMLEDNYATGGLINLGKVNIPDAGITQAKIAGLVAALAGKAVLTVSTGTPATPNQGDLWVNTSYSVPALMFYDGTRWLSSSPNGMIPLPLAADSLKFLRLNSTATALEYAAFDTSGLVQTSTVGSANGVAALNALGKVPSTNMPDYVAQAPIIGRLAGTLANSSIVVGHIYGNSYTFTQITAKLTSGTATLQLQVGGVNIGSTLAVTSTTATLPITPSIIDSTAAVKDIVLVISGSATPVDLTFNVGCSITG